MRVKTHETCSSLIEKKIGVWLPGSRERWAGVEMWGWMLGSRRLRHTI